MYLEYLRITNVALALIFMSLYALLSGAIGAYISSMVTTIEKRFGFDSLEMGALLGANDLGYLTCIIFISYFGSKNDRQSFILFLSATGLWLSSVLYSIPYVIYGPRYEAGQLVTGNSTTEIDVCLLNVSLVSVNAQISSEVGRGEKSLAQCIFMVAGVLSGVATCPFWNLGVSFLDDMTGAAKSGIYIGILFGVRSIGPIIGFLLGSVMAKLHESLKLNVEGYLPGQKDIKWIGAWWLGWLILGFAVLLTGPFLGLLKVKHARSAINEQRNRSDIQKGKQPNFGHESKFQQLKELLSVIVSTFKNKVYTILLVGIIFDVISNVCMLTFFTKYLEYHFRATTSVTNFLTAIALAGSRFLSCLLSGIISKLFPMSIRGLNKFIAATNVVSALIFPTLFGFTCPTANISGINEQAKVCSGTCHCEFSKLSPVCISNTTYFSPCSAGCTVKINETFFGGCECTHTMMARMGFCEDMCPSVYGFLITFFIIKFIASLSSVQFCTVMLRLCDQKFKAVSLSIIGFIFGVFGLVFPPLAGIMLDSACIFRNTNKLGVKSHCLLYDTDTMRYLIIGVSFVFQIPFCLLIIVAWLLTPVDLGNMNGISPPHETHENIL